MMTENDRLLREVASYYSEKVGAHGASPRGADWNSEESQRLRFEVLLRVIGDADRFSINDYGCGYGALIDHLSDSGRRFEYVGYDISESMLETARRLHPSGRRAFVSEKKDLQTLDYTLASGIFNVRLSTGTEEWEEYILEILQEMDALSTRGFAFNMLSTYSDAERRRAYLYYGDPLFYFDYCKRNFSRFVALVHDYPLYEFTVLVRKGDD